MSSDQRFFRHFKNTFLLWISSANVTNFGFPRIVTCVPEVEIWEDWKFFRFCYELYNLRDCRLGLTSWNLVVWKFGISHQKPNIGQLPIYWEKPKYRNFTYIKRVSQEFWPFKSCVLLEIFKVWIIKSKGTYTLLWDLISGDLISAGIFFSIRLNRSAWTRAVWLRREWGRLHHSCCRRISINRHHLYCHGIPDCWIDWLVMYSFP